MNHKVKNKKLNQFDEYFRVTLDSIGDAVIATDRNERITLMNNIAERLTGWNREEVIGKPLKDVFVIINEYTKESVSNPVAKVLSTGKIVGLANHTALIRPDGSLRSIADSAAPILLDNGKIDGVVMVFRDVTEERKIEIALKASEERYRTMFENTGTAMVIIDEDTTILHANRQMEILCGYSKDEIEGQRSIFDFIAVEDRARMFKYHKARRKQPYNEEAPPRVYEFKFIGKDQVERVALCTVELIPGTAETVASFLDITERKQAEAQALFLIYHDHLTGLYNRTYFDKHLKKIDHEDYLPLGVIIGDVNGLKLINDAFGHEAGDTLLKRIAAIIKYSARPGDLIARWGGDEFIILLPNCSEEEVYQVMNNIKRECAQDQGENPVKLSISLGHAIKYDVTDEIREILALGENRMYQQKLMETTSFRNAIIASLKESLRERNFETEKHAQRLKELSWQLGQALGLSENQLNELALLAALHDIGKLGIPDHILLKPGPLTDSEWTIMKRHPEIGYRITSSSPELIHIAEAILAHHERWDGKGYPREIAGEDIPLLARIIAIVDAFDAMTNDRPYKKKISEAAAIKELKRCSGTQFDPKLVKVFLDVLT